MVEELIVDKGINLKHKCFDLRGGHFQKEKSSIDLVGHDDLQGTTPFWMRMKMLLPVRLGAYPVRVHLGKIRLAHPHLNHPRSDRSF